MEWEGDKGPFFGKSKEKKDGAKKKKQAGERGRQDVCRVDIFKKTGHRERVRDDDERTITPSLLNRNRHLFGNVNRRRRRRSSSSSHRHSCK